MNPAVADYLSSKTNRGRLSLYPPATDLALKINALFNRDPNVFTIWNYDERTLTVYVKGSDKRADAINWLLGHKDRSAQISDKFNVKVLSVHENGASDELPVPTYDVNPQGVIDFMKSALNGLGYSYQFNDVFVPITQTTYHFLEVEAAPIVVGNDNFGNPYGFSVILLEDLIKLAFDIDFLMVSTYVRKNTGEISE